jgi:hypothetical protein
MTDAQIISSRGLFNKNMIFERLINYVTSRYIVTVLNVVDYSFSLETSELVKILILNFKNHTTFCQYGLVNHDDPRKILCN